MFSYALSEPEAGSDAAAIRPGRCATATAGVLNGVKRWITNAGVSRYYTVMAVTDPDAGTRGISAFVVHDDDDGLQPRCARAQARHQGIADPRALLRRRAPRRRPPCRDPGTGFATALRTLDHTRPTIAAQAVGIAQGALDFAIGYVKERKQFGRAVAEFQGLQFMLADMAMAVRRRPAR